MRSKVIIALVAVVAMALIARGCLERRDSAATKVETADNAAAGEKSQPMEFSLSADDDGGFDLPEREEIRQKRKLTPGTEVFVVGTDDVRVDAAHTQAFVIGVNGKVKVETADTDAAEVLIVRSARRREDLRHSQAKIVNVENLLIRINDGNSSDPVPEIRRRVFLRLPRKAGLEIREIGGDVTVGEIHGRAEVMRVDGAVRVARAAGQIKFGEINGGVDVTFASLTGNVVRSRDVNFRRVIHKGPGALLVGNVVSIRDVNGDVDRRFEGEVNADINAWSVTGKIAPDPPNVEKAPAEPSVGGLKARVGAGGATIEIHRVNGNVTLSKAANRDASALKAAGK